MKKVSILFLLTLVLASFTFAIDGVGDFEIGVETAIPNVGGANKSDPLVYVEPYIEFSRSFGAFGIAVTVDNYLEIDTDSDIDNPVYDELFLQVKPSYTIDAGPGSLRFSLAIRPVFNLVNYGGDPEVWFDIDPVVKYTADLFFLELGTDHLFIEKGADVVSDDYGVKVDQLYFKAGVTLPFGLGIWVSPRFVFAKEANGFDSNRKPKNKNADVFHSFRADVSYDINETVSFGVEGRFRVGDYAKLDGHFIKPHVDLSFGAVAVWVAAEIDGIGNDVDADPEITPVVGVSYKF
ncbi:hypothetical protein FACS1894137_17330 [Spirochaetia bacterium]|nr:hypothetical protein FACS1894137_17330 [Spirochaetia bacterium]